MPMDLSKIDDQNVLTADLPGVDPGSVDVNVDNGILTISEHRNARSDDGGVPGAVYKCLMSVPLACICDATRWLWNRLVPGRFRCVVPNSVAAVGWAGVACCGAGPAVIGVRRRSWRTRATRPRRGRV